MGAREAVFSQSDGGGERILPAHAGCGACRSAEVRGTYPCPMYAVRILAGCNGNATAREVVKHVREGRNDDPPVCYGAVGDADRLCMGLANDETVRRPGLVDEL